jgi:hypothetical protein
MKPLALSGVERVWGGRGGGGDLPNIQCKTIQNWYNESLPYNEYKLKKKKKKRKPLLEAGCASSLVGGS